MTHRVLIASPVRQDPDVLRAFLEGLARLKADGLRLSYCFVDDNDDVTCSELLDGFLTAKEGLRVRLDDRPEAYVRDECTHRWRQSLIERVASIKNYLLALAREGGFDSLFLVDSDLVLHPDTLVHLVALEKPIVSEVFWTQWEPDAPAQPQTWLMDHYTMYTCEPGEVVTAEQAAQRSTAFLHRMRDGGCHRVGGLGACTLISQHALGRGLSFSSIPNISFWGEDRAFCIRAAALGVELWADTRYPPLHLYRKTDLQRLPRFWERVARNYEANPHLTLTVAIHHADLERVRITVCRHRDLVDHINLIIDGESGVNLVGLRESLANVPHSLFHLSKSIGTDRYVLRRLAWELTVKANPDWVLVLDPGEYLDDGVLTSLRPRLNVPGGQVVELPVLRHGVDSPSQPSMIAALTRYTPDFAYLWNEQVRIDRRFPDSSAALPQEVLAAATALA